uniref:Stimulator of interferon genes protein isoform X3 n=1 Tax=Petromyzon marinus TaxID=7757 RepID=A0AAJ7X8A9_PETMA|nr:stimulator of interferon genes protein isoform X3 [Petromyzon marinus]
MDTTEIFDMIPAERGHMKQFAATIILLLVFGVTLYFCGGDLSIAFQAFYQAFILQIITTTITSLCYFMEEKNHLKTSNIWKNAINQAPSKADISDISERKHLNVAHGLAWSYYFGYLKLVLPELDVKLAQYKREGRTFTASTRKLFILLPLSCHVTDTFSEQDQHISVDGNLSEIQRNRGGVSMRSFKHTVHRVLDAQNVEHYIVMEFATPLRSLHDMSNQTLAAFSTDDRLEQAKLFYCTLKKIIQSDIDIRNKVQLVLYDDTAEAKNPHFLSEKILKYVSPMADESPLQFSMEDQPQPLRSY